MLQTTTTAAYFLSPPSLSLSCTLYGKSDHIHTHTQNNNNNGKTVISNCRWWDSVTFTNNFYCTL